MTRLFLATRPKAKRETKLKIRSAKSDTDEIKYVAHTFVTFVREGADADFVKSGDRIFSGYYFRFFIFR